MPSLAQAMGYAMAIDVLDLAVVVVYLVGITGLGLWFSRRQRETSAGYFLAGRSLGWVTVGLALFATNISAVHLTGLAGAGYSEGMVFGNFEWLAPLMLLVLGLVFAPYYFRTRVATLPEYLEGRYGPGSRTVLAIMGVVGALFIHIGVTLYAGAEVVKAILPLPAPAWWGPVEPYLDFNIAVSLAVVSGLTILYTALGGLKAVVATEAIQAVLLLLGAAAVLGFGLARVAERGVTSLPGLHRACAEQEAREARARASELRDDGKETAAAAEDQKASELEAAAASARPYSRRLSMIRTEGGYAWWVMLLGYPVLGLWYWCSDQTIVQRVLGARTEWDAQVGPIFSGFIKVLPVFLMVLPGVLGYVLFADKIRGNSDGTLSVLIVELLPTGVKGVVLAGLLAALMSTVAGALNSVGTLVSIDLVQRLRPATPERTLVRVGQLTSVVGMALALAWSTQGARFGGIFAGINQMISVLAPPISTVFVWGIFWRRGTAAASLVTLLGGFALGAVVFVLDFPAFGLQLLTERLGLPFLLQAWLLFAACSVLYVAVSLLTPPPAREQVEKFCWKNPLTFLTGTRLTGPADPRLLAVVLLAVMAALYAVFA